MKINALPNCYYIIIGLAVPVNIYESSRILLMSPFYSSSLQKVQLLEQNKTLYTLLVEFFSEQCWSDGLGQRVHVFPQNQKESSESTLFSVLIMLSCI